MTTPNSTPDWDSAETLEGLDILDKSQLKDVPFRITGCMFQENKEGISICYIDGERKEDSYEFTFLDSSSGVRQQLVKYLTDKGKDAALDTGEYVELNLFAPNGLRVSEYMVDERGPNGQPIKGKQRAAKTYYLTTSGRRTVRSEAAAKAAAPKRGTTAK